MADMGALIWGEALIWVNTVIHFLKIFLKVLYD